jgi:cytidylate kinase
VAVPASERPRPVIAIDGPVGAGKSTVAAAVAQRLGYRYVDTGAMYRAVAWKARAEDVDVNDREAVAAIARGVQIEFLPARRGQRVLVDGADVTEAIRSPRISEQASVVSAYPEVREAMVALQRRMGALGGVVMEGRDIGTVVFPGAEVKVFLTASPEERARRRTEELRAKGLRVDFAETLREVQLRDRQDSTRAHAPLRKAETAVELVTDGLAIDEVVDRIARLVLVAAGEERV